MAGLADIASIVTSGATCVALIFAGLELRQSRARDRRNRQVEIEGVAVSWRPPEVPRGPQDSEGPESLGPRIHCLQPGAAACQRRADSGPLCPGCRARTLRRS